MRKKLLLAVFCGLASLGLLKSDMVFDGGGGILDLSSTFSIQVTPGAQLTLRNITLDKLSFTRLIMDHVTSKIVLDDCTIVLDGDYTFTQGAIEVLGNSTIRGRGHTFNFQGHNLLIRKDSSLNVKDCSFKYNPTTLNPRCFRFEDETAALHLNSGTFKVENNLGCIFVGGNLVIDGGSLIDNNLGYVSDSITNTHAALQLGNGAYSDADCKLIIMPEGKLKIKNAGLINRNLSATTIIDVNGGNGAIEFDPTPGAFCMFNNLINLNDDQLSIVGTTTALHGQIDYNIYSSATSLLDTTTTATVNDVSFHPSFQYYVTGGDAINPGSEINLYQWSAGAPTWQNFVELGVTVTAVDWSPNGQYIAVATALNGGGAEVFVYRFTAPSTLTFVTSIEVGITVNKVHWSPDGRYLAFGTAVNSGVHELWIYKFDGTSLTLHASKDIGADVYAVRWSSCGQYLGVLERNYALDDNYLRIYDISLNLIVSQVIGPKTFWPYALDWSPEGKYLVGFINSRIYLFNRGAKTISGFLQNSSVSITTYYDYKWSPNGSFIVGAGVGADNYSVEIYRFTGSAVDFVTGALATSQIDIGADYCHSAQLFMYGNPWQYYLKANATEPLVMASDRAYLINLTGHTPWLKFEDSYIALQKDLLLTNISLRTEGS